MGDRIHSYQETLRIGLRLYRGLIVNSFGGKAPLFAGHKLTYNCNLRCKMCPFWRRFSDNLSLQKEKLIVKQIYDSGACGIGFEGGEPLLRKDLPQILAYSRSLPLHTSLVTNGTLLKSRIDEIAPYINGILFVSIDGMEKTHDQIRGVNGCFKAAIEGITEAKSKVSVTINTTIMADNIHEIEDTVRLAKDLGVRTVLSVAYDYQNSQEPHAQANDVKEVAKRLIELKSKGYPIMNSKSYLKVIAKQKKWKCKPWSIVNIGTDGQLVLPCYVHNEYEASTSVFRGNIHSTVSKFNWKEFENCERCYFHCYVEPSLVISWDLGSWSNWIIGSKFKSTKRVLPSPLRSHKQHRNNVDG